MSDYQFRALVVDDEAATRKNLTRLLKEYDFVVETAADGEEGLQKLLTDEFDVAVVDLKMPKMGGIEMLRKADEAEVDTYAVILTGHGDKDEAVAALRLREMVKEWFEKPILDDEAFAQLIKQVASTGGVSRELVSRIMSKLPPVPNLR